MGLETGTYVSDLNTSNPTNGDAVSQGAGHLRLIKAVLQATFPDANAPIYGLRAATVQNLSGTSVSFTDIPSWVQRITVTISGLSTSGTSRPMLQLGDSGGAETSGYSGSVVISGTGASADNSIGFLLAETVSAATAITGRVVLERHNTTNTWIATSHIISSGGSLNAGGGAKTLSATLDRIVLKAFNGTDTFDAGTANILYE